MHGPGTGQHTLRQLHRWRQAAGAYGRFVDSFVAYGRCVDSFVAYGRFVDSFVAYGSFVDSFVPLAVRAARVFNVHSEA